MTARNRVARSQSPSRLALMALVMGMAFATVGSRPATAGPTLDEAIFGGSLLVATTGGVTAKFLGSDAGYFNTLYLVGFDDPIFDKDSRLFSEVIFPAPFSAGTELVFRLDVSNTAPSYFSGDKLRNPDDLPHTKAVTTFDEQTGTFVTTVGFEDLLGGGDNDYNDFMFQLTNVTDPPPTEAAPAPAPPVLALLGLGLAGIAFRARRRTDRV